MANNLSTSDLSFLEGNTASDSSQSANMLSTISNYDSTVYIDDDMEDLYDDDFIKKDNITLSFTNESENVFVFDWHVFYLGKYNNIFRQE